MRQWPSTSSRLALKRSTTGVASVITVETKPGPPSVLCWISSSRASEFLLKDRCDLIDSRIASRALLFVRVCMSVLAQRSTPDLAKTLTFDRAQITIACPCSQRSSYSCDSLHLSDLALSNQHALKYSAESGAQLVQPRF